MFYSNVKCQHVTLSTVENVYLTSCPLMSTLYLKHFYQKVMQGIFTSICCIVLNPVEVSGISRQLLHVWTDTLMYVMCVSVNCSIASFFLLPSLPRSISRATHGSSQNEIILHHSVGTWKANLQPGWQLITSFPKPLCRSVIKTNWSSQWNGTLKYGCIRKQIL